MAHLIRVADLDELPPGKGKTLYIEGRDVTVANVEGRLVATATAPRHVEPTMATTCGMPGRTFDVGQSGTPDPIKWDELHYQVTVRDGGVFVLVEEGDARPGEEPHVATRSRRRRKRR